MKLTHATITGDRLTAAKFTFDSDSGRFVIDWNPDGTPILSPEWDTVERFFAETRPDLGYVVND